jgi:hypothetical protein
VLLNIPCWTATPLQIYGRGLGHPWSVHLSGTIRIPLKEINAVSSQIKSSVNSDNNVYHASVDTKVISLLNLYLHLFQHEDQSPCELLQTFNFFSDTYGILIPSMAHNPFE